MTNEERAAHLWCLPETKHLVMIPPLAKAIAQALDAAGKRGFEECRRKAANYVTVEPLEDLEPCCLAALLSAEQNIRALEWEEDPK